MRRTHPVLPFAAVLAGIALLSLMDALMKSASLAIGAYSTLLVRSVFGLALAGPIWLAGRS
jgi:S-adenosylmethionine uptake transporter